MDRYVDWEARLSAYLDPLRLMPFEWGRHDCCTFAAGAVYAMTGFDHMAEFRGRYTTRIGSLRALKRFGAGALAPTLDQKFTPIAAATAQRGDIVMSGGALGICMGAALIAVGSVGDREGLVLIERAKWDEPFAWAVGRSC